MTTTKQQKKALNWWGNLTDIQKHETRGAVSFSHGRSWQNMSAEEVFIIWRNSIINHNLLIKHHSS